MSGQWVTMSAEAKPWCAKVSPRQRGIMSASGRGRVLGLLTGRGSVTGSVMSVTGDAAPRKKVASARPQGATRQAARPKAAALLAWYDRSRRVLAWRAPPGARPDPYRVWLSEIMLQQTSVKTVTPYYARFLDRF